MVMQFRKKKRISFKSFARKYAKPIRIINLLDHIIEDTKDISVLEDLITIHREKLNDSDILEMHDHLTCLSKEKPWADLSGGCFHTVDTALKSMRDKNDESLRLYARIKDIVCSIRDNYIKKDIIIIRANVEGTMIIIDGNHRIMSLYYLLKHKEKIKKSFFRNIYLITIESDINKHLFPAESLKLKVCNNL